MSITFAASASSMEANAQAQEIIARNLANVATSGFKKGIVVFEEFSNVLADALGGSSGATVTDSGEAVDFGQGSFTYTAGPLDIALKGDNNFFVLQDPANPGSSYFTRKGQFTLNSSRQIVNSVGLPVMGESGPIILPEETSQILISGDGTVMADGNAVGKLMVAHFDDASSLQRTNFTAFKEPAGVAMSTPAQDYEVKQGYVEESNVNVLSELVTMIAVLRNFESNMRAVSTTDQTLEQLVASV